MYGCANVTSPQRSRLRRRVALTVGFRPPNRNLWLARTPAPSDSHLPRISPITLSERNACSGYVTSRLLGMETSLPARTSRCTTTHASSCLSSARRMAQRRCLPSSSARAESPTVKLTTATSTPQRAAATVGTDYAPNMRTLARRELLGHRPIGAFALRAALGPLRSVKWTSVRRPREHQIDAVLARPYRRGGNLKGQQPPRSRPVHPCSKVE